MQSHSQKPQSFGRHKLIIAIDLATTRCCVTTGRQVISSDNVQLPLDIVPYSRWISSYETGRIWPLTCLYYGSERLPTTGHALEPIFRDPLPEAFNVDKFFRLWKLLFHDHQNDPMTKEIQEKLQEQLRRLGKSAVSLLHDWVELIYNEIFVEGSDGLWSLQGYYNKFHPRDLEIVVTVPPGRSVIAHEQVPEAFVQGPIGAHQVFLVSEPEAMFRSWVHDGAHPDDFKVNRRYLVVDGGGGTSCIVRFRLDRLDPLGFAQEYESESTTSAAEMISTSFQKLADTKVPANHPHRDWTLDRLRREFDEYCKIYFGASNEQKDYAIVMPGAQDEILRFSYQQIAKCFDQCIEKLIKGIRRQQNRGSKVDYLVLGGGLFSSPYVMKSIRKEFGSMTIRELSANKGHVARGAVLVRACAGADFITTRPIIRSKGVVTWIEVTDGIRASPSFPYLDLRKSRHDKKMYFYAVQWLAKRGDDAKDLHEIASEATFETARTRLFDLDTKDLEFSEKIVTVSYSPDDAQWAAFRHDGRLMDQSGNLIPDPEESEFITWNLSLVGLPLEDLKVKRPKRGRAHRELRYSILMQLKEVSTKYWIKAWSLRKPEVGCVKPSPRAWTSAPTERNALFTRQEISKSLSESFKLGKGLSRDVGANEDALNLLRDRPQPHCDAYSSHQPSASSLPQKASRKTMQLVEKVATSSNIPGEERLTAVQPSLVSPLDENRLAQTNLLPRRLLIQDRPTPNLLQSSPNSQRDVGPSHRQNTERNVEYSVGPRRNNGGEPQDIYLFPDFKCEYNRPQWLDGDKLRQSQKHISEALIKERRIRTGNRASRSARSGLSSPVPAGPSVNSFVPVNRKTNFAAANLIKPQQPKSREPPVVGRVGRHLDRLPLANVAQQGKTSAQASKCEQVQNGDDGLYNASPPPRKRQRRPLKPSPEPVQPPPSNSMATETRRRKSSRQRVKPSLGANMLLWEDIDDEELDPDD